MLCLKTTAQAINAANYLNRNWLPHLISTHMTFESGFPHVWACSRMIFGKGNNVLCTESMNLVISSLCMPHA